MDEAKPLRGRVAVITGDSNGIGAAAVRGISKLGANVVIGYRHPGRAASNLRVDPRWYIRRGACSDSMLSTDRRHPSARPALNYYSIFRNAASPASETSTHFGSGTALAT